MQSLFPTTPAELTTDDLVELYAYPAERRWARANFVSTVDGAAHGADNKSGSISSQADKRLFALLRSLADVIVVGAGTARAEGYLPVQPAEVLTEVRSDQGLTLTPTIAVVSRSLRLDPGLLAGGPAPTIVLTSEACPEDRRREVQQHAEVILCGEDDVDVVGAFEVLSHMGLHRILCEGGPSIMHRLCETEALDELCLTLSPLITAGTSLRFAQGADLLPPGELHLRHVLEEDGALFLRYLLGREAPPDQPLS